MSNVSKLKDFWESRNIHFEPLEDEKLYRIVHLRDAYFLDNMYFRGKKAAQDYLDLHMCKVAALFSVRYIPMDESIVYQNLSKVVNDNQRIHFDIVEV